MAAAALAAAPEIINGIAGGLALTDHLADKYGHGGKKMVNTLFSSKGRKSAKHMLARAVKNPGRTAKHISQYISSGKALKSVSGLANDAHAVTGMVGNLTGKDMSETHEAIQGAKNKATHFHQVAEGYNEQGKAIHEQTNALLNRGN